MNIEFKVTAEEHQHEDLIPYTNALQRDAFLFELFNNFFRSYKHLEEDLSLDKIKEDLYELKEKYKVIVN